MAAGALIVIFIVVLGIVVFGGFFGATGLAKAGRSRTTEAGGGELSFPVPNGVDPAVVVDALSNDGYDATQGEDDTHQPVVVIRAEDGAPDREDVRSALQRVPFRDGDQPAGVPIRFSDE